MSARESRCRHLWVGGLPDDIDETGIKEFFSKFGKVEGVKILPQRFPNLGVAAFVDFFDVRSAIEAKEAKLKLQGCEIRTNFKSKQPTGKYERREGSAEKERSEKEKSEKARDVESSSSSSSSGSESSSSSSSSSESDEEHKEGKTKGKKKKGRDGDAETKLLKVSGLAARPERVLQDGLYYEFTRHCPGAIVKMYGEGADKLYGVVKFNTVEECKSAFDKAQGLSLFGTKIKLSFLNKEDFPSGGRDAPFQPGGPPGGRGPPPMGGPNYLPDDLDPQATRSLFVGNIPKNISVYELRDIFQRYGNVLDVEIKKMSGAATYGFVLFDDLMDAVAAKHYMDGQNIRGNKIRVGFGKGTPSKTLWIDGIDTTMSESQMERHLSKYGSVSRLGMDRQHGCCMVQYDSMEEAKEALHSVKGMYIGNSRRLMTDFANRDARAAFFSRIERGVVEPPPPRGFPPGGPVDMYGPPRGRGGMMMPRPGMHMMGMGRGGYLPPGHGPPMDYYYPPFMDEGMYFGGGRPPFHGHMPMGMRRFPPHHHIPFEEGFDEYEEELRAFTRKREWEREREKRHERKKRRDESSGESGESESDESSSRRRKSGRDKEKHKKASRKDKTKSKGEAKSEGETGSDEGDEEKREEARMKATQKSRDLREKLKKKSRKKKDREVHMSDDGEASSESEGDQETADRKRTRKEKSREKAKETEREGKDRSKHREPEKGREKSKTSKREKGDEKKPSKKRPVATPPQSDKRKPSKEREKVSEEATEKASEQKTETTPDSKPKTPPEPSRNGGDIQEPDGPRSKSKSPAPKPTLEEEAKEAVVEKMDVSEPDGGTETVEIADTPQSPPPEKKGEGTKVLLGSRSGLESDLSSGEDFKDSESEAFPVETAGPGESEGWKETEKERKKEREGEGKGEETEKEERVEKGVVCREQEKGVEPLEERMVRAEPLERGRQTHPSGIKSPDSDPNGSEGRPSSPPYPPPPSTGPFPPSSRHKPSLSEESEGGKASDSDVGRKVKKLPRRYQLEEEERREKTREQKEQRHQRKPQPPPTSPSPPPAFVSHRRRHLSPPSHEQFDRRWHRRGRPYSPVPYGHRRHSRSPPPPGYPPSPPPHRPQSPYPNSPPPRPRTPIQRPGRERSGQRQRYESPPPPLYEPRGKYPRRGTPPSRHYTPSPPLRSRSPGRRYPRHRSPTPSPPRRSPIRRRERSRSTESGRSSPRYPDDKYDRYRHGKRPGYSHTPSPPRPKHREVPSRDDHPEAKRRRVEDPRPKSPSGSPPPPKEEARVLKSEKPLPAPSSGTSAGKMLRTDGKVKGHGERLGGSSQYGGQQHGAKVGQKAVVAPQGPQGQYHGQQSPSIQGTAHSHTPPQPTPVAQQQAQAGNLLDLLRRYPVMWQGHLTLKNDSAAVQLHFLSGNVNLAKLSLPQAVEQRTPNLRIAQRMRLEQTQLEGVERRVQNEAEHCLLLALPCGRDANDVRVQTHALKNNLISYLLQKQAAGIINVQGPHTGFVLHIFPPCPFSQNHLTRVAPDLLSSASDNCHLMIVIATM